MQVSVSRRNFTSPPAPCPGGEPGEVAWVHWTKSLPVPLGPGSHWRGTQYHYIALSKSHGFTSIDSEFLRQTSRLAPPMPEQLDRILGDFLGEAHVTTFQIYILVSTWLSRPWPYVHLDVRVDVHLDNFRARVRRRQLPRLPARGRLRLAFRLRNPAKTQRICPILGTIRAARAITRILFGEWA
jgi:hypothetical protein